MPIRQKDTAKSSDFISSDFCHVSCCDLFRFFGGDASSIFWRKVRRGLSQFFLQTLFFTKLLWQKFLLKFVWQRFLSKKWQTFLFKGSCGRQFLSPFLVKNISSKIFVHLFHFILASLMSLEKFFGRHFSSNSFVRKYFLIFFWQTILFG